MSFQFNKSYFLFALLLFIVEVCIALFLKSGFIRHTFGDYLVVILLYCFIRAISNLSMYTIAIFTLIIAFTIEFLQLTPILSVLNLENNQLAKIIFGTTFQFTDLLAYTLGVITTIFIETYLNGKN